MLLSSFFKTVLYIGLHEKDWRKSLKLFFKQAFCSESYDYQESDARVKIHDFSNKLFFTFSGHQLKPDEIKPVVTKKNEFKS